MMRRASPPANDLEAAALELLEAHRQQGSAATFAALEAFSDQSPLHSEALDNARQFLRAANRLRRPERGPWQEFLYRFELIWVRVSGSSMTVNAAMLMLAIGGLWWMTNLDTTAVTDQPVVASKPATLEYRTGWRQQQEVQLEDGSTLWLGWNSSASVTMTPAARRVTLHAGVAAFKVTKNTARPFIVSARDVETRVTGTEFVVNRQRAEQVQVAVLEGTVVVAESQSLSAAQTITVDRGVVGEVQNQPIDEIGQWRNGMLVFNKRPLLEALAAIAPYSQYELDTHLISYDRSLVSGVFYLDQADEALITILESHRISAVQTGERRLRLQYGSYQRP